MMLEVVEAPQNKKPLLLCLEESRETLHGSHLFVQNLDLLSVLLRLFMLVVDCVPAATITKVKMSVPQQLLAHAKTQNHACMQS